MAHSYQFVAGPYRALWNGLALGQAEDGITFEYSMDAEPIVGDNLGSTVQDLIYRGAEVWINGMFTEAKALGQLVAVTNKPSWPWDDTFGKVGRPGILANSGSKGKPLVLTKVAGTSAIYSTITCAISILASRYPVSQLLGNHLHRVPLRFHILPDGVLDAEAFFTAVLAP